MKLLDRIFFAILSLIVAIGSIIFIGASFNDWMFNWTNYSITRGLRIYHTHLEYCVIPLILLIICIRFLTLGKHDKKHKSYNGLIRHTTYGEVQISLKTIEGLAYKASNMVQGIKEIKAIAIQKQGELTIHIQALSTSDINIPEAVTLIQKNIKEKVESCTGVQVSEIKVSIQDIAQHSKRRVE